MSFTEHLRKTPALNRYLVIFGILFFVSQGLLIWVLDDVAPQLLAIQTTFTESSFHAIVDKWESDEINKFRMHFHLDIVHPIWYALFFAAALAKLFNLNNITNRYNGFIWLPIIAGFCDFAENSMHAPFASNLANISQPYIILAAAFATTKWIFVGCFTVGIVLLLCRYYALRKRSR